MNLDLLCFCHLRWNFVFQRPQHLISRFSKSFRTFYVEEPVYNDQPDGYTTHLNKENVWIVVPHLNDQTEGNQTIRQRAVLDRLMVDLNIKDFISWYYTPMALSF